MPITPGYNLMRKLTQRKKRDGQGLIPTDSMSDIAFLLLIFFILTTTFLKPTGRLIDLPAGEKSDETAKDTPTIQLSGNQILFNENAVDEAALERELARLELPQREGEKKVVLLEAKADVPYQAYYSAMNAITAAGGIVGIMQEDKGGKK